MAIPDEHFLPGPGVDPDTEVYPSVVKGFMRHTIWPAVNTLWGGDFLTDSLPDEYLSIERTVVDRVSREPSAIYRLLANCGLDADLESDEEIVVRSAQIFVVEHVPDATAGLLVDINRQYKALDRKSGFPLEPVDGLSAWLNKEYTFSDAKDQPFHVMPFLELRASDDLETLWDQETQDELRIDSLEAKAKSADQEDPERQDEEYLLFMQFEDELPPIFTTKDLRAVCTALETLKLL
ncbi:MAG: hypothetical protein QG553_62 [Patescibacteria group bacterium]|nr:hypothetical protein [Patescibacteria group bacterium]